MDPLRRAFYEQAFEKEFLKRKGSSFQDFFSEIMEKCHPGDFQRVRPWGRMGDEKNDGYQKSERKLFQVYAPNEIKASVTIDKIDEDFKKALPHWQKYFDSWIFVHNSREGLGPEVLKKLLELDERNKSIKIIQWGFEELKQKIFTLDEGDIASVLGGPFPSYEDMGKIGYKDLEPIFESISKKTPPADVDLRPVSIEKLSANGLSADVETLLKAGMRKAVLVEKFFNEWHDPRFGDAIATAFKQKYMELKNLEFTPNTIFTKLQEFAGGDRRGDATHEAAVLAVLAHLFEKCEIFENPITGEIE